MRKSQSIRLFPNRGVAAGAAFLSVALLASSAHAESCLDGPLGDAARNAATFDTLADAPFGRPEVGWASYDAWIRADIGTTCGAATPAFARALSRWRARRGLGGSGVIDAQTLAAFRQVWSARRPFVAVSKRACPLPPDESTLAVARADESYGGKRIQLRPGALTAYRRMAAAARAAGATAGGADLLKIFSGYRSPAYDAARCATQGNCQGLTRASCSPHRTGLAMDLNLGAAPGRAVDSADDVNRLYLSRTAAYRWLVLNAGRYGFVNYVFEPWHWEWTGEAP